MLLFYKLGSDDTIPLYGLKNLAQRSLLVFPNFENIFYESIWKLKTKDTPLKSITQQNESAKVIQNEIQFFSCSFKKLTAKYAIIKHPFLIFNTSKDDSGIVLVVFMKTVQFHFDKLAQTIRLLSKKDSNWKLQFKINLTHEFISFQNAISISNRLFHKNFFRV